MTPIDFPIERLNEFFRDHSFEIQNPFGDGLNEKINVLINYVDLSKIMTLQDEINELRSRFDVLLNYIDLSK